MNFIEALEQKFEQKRNREKAIPMENYMKNNFSFIGLKTEERRAIFKLISFQYKEEIQSNFRKIAFDLFQKKEREFQYCGIEILMKQIKRNYIKEDIKLIEKFIITNSWWDSVDVVAKYLLGGYLQVFPNETPKIIENFSNANNMWLNRSVLLFQLSYKQKTDFDLLKSECIKHQESKEFFIQKAIGWALREYSKCNPNGVFEFVNQNNLKPLSKKEAIRLIINK